MAAGGQLAPEGDGGEGVAGVAERGEQEAPRDGALQTSSASVRTIRLRSSVSNDIGVVMIVPTPASR